LKRDKLIALSRLLNISPVEIIGGEIVKDQHISKDEFFNRLSSLLSLTDLSEQEKSMILEYVQLICKAKGE